MFSFPFFISPCSNFFSFFFLFRRYLQLNFFTSRWTALSRGRRSFCSFPDDNLSTVVRFFPNACLLKEEQCINLDKQQSYPNSHPLPNASSLKMPAVHAPSDPFPHSSGKVKKNKKKPSLWNTPSTLRSSHVMQLAASRCPYRTTSHNGGANEAWRQKKQGHSQDGFKRYKRSSSKRGGDSVSVSRVISLCSEFLASLSSPCPGKISYYLVP